MLVFVAFLWRGLLLLAAAHARGTSVQGPDLATVRGQVVSGHCQRTGATEPPGLSLTLPCASGLLAPPRRKLKWKSPNRGEGGFSFFHFLSFVEIKVPSAPKTGAVEYQ